MSVDLIEDITTYKLEISFKNQTLWTGCEWNHYTSGMSSTGEYCKWKELPITEIK